MRLVTPDMVRAYCQADIVSQWLDSESNADDEAMTCQRWLRQTPAKRAAFLALYGDLLDAHGPRRRVLDVGGGLTSLTTALARRHNYTLVDLMAHDTAPNAKRVMAAVGREFICSCDWYDWQHKEAFDVVVSNDLFPNVDQRLELFIERMLPACHELRLSLTYYNTPRFYMTRRVDAEEFLCMLAWNGQMTQSALTKFTGRIDLPNLEILQSNESSAYSNGRQVCLVRMRGDLAEKNSLRIS